MFYKIYYHLKYLHADVSSPKKNELLNYIIISWLEKISKQKTMVQHKFIIRHHYLWKYTKY